MLLGMLERDMKIDCILFCDTGLEFPAMYDHIAKVEKDIGRKITSVRAEHTYEELMFDVPVRRSADSPVVRQYGVQLNGYGWPGPRQRWCTTRLKAMPRERFLRELRKQYEVIEYVGIAADEQYRLERANNQNPNHRHPLVDWAGQSATACGTAMSVDMIGMACMSISSVCPAGAVRCNR